MQVVDLSHVMNVHTPGWVGYAGNKMYYAQNLQTQMIVAQRIETALHVGTPRDTFRPDAEGGPVRAALINVVLTFRAAELDATAAQRLLQRIRDLLETPLLLLAS